MNIQYFPDTDTVYIQLTDHYVVDTQELNENTIIDLDEDGNLVAITLEHAQEMANIYQFSFQQVYATERIRKKRIAKPLAAALAA